MPVKEEKSKKQEKKDVSSESSSDETGSTGSGESIEGSSSGTGSTASSTTSSASSSTSSSQASTTKMRVTKRETVVGGSGERAIERDKELDSLTIEMRSGKRLFVDAKENQRGKFIRMAEAPGRNMGRSFGNRQGGRIIMRLKIAKELAERLDEFTDAAEGIMESDNKREEGKPEAVDTKIAGGRVRPAHTSVILDEGRRYFIDLLPSRFKGREPLLRITMNNPVSGLRNSITVESGEAPYLKKALGVLLEKFYDEQEEQEDKAEMEMAHHSVRFGRRTFFFDPGRQSRGKFVRITEVSMRDGRAMRNSVMLPDKLLAQFSKILSDYDGKLNTGDASAADGGGGKDASSAASGEGVKKEGTSDKKEEVKADAA